jgi:hypothetical protein
MADAITPDSTSKQSTVGSLLAGAQSSLTNLFHSSNSTASGLTSGGSSTSTSFLTNPIVWVAVVVAGVVVYFAKFKKKGRRGVSHK